MADSLEMQAFVGTRVKALLAVVTDSQQHSIPEGFVKGEGVEVEGQPERATEGSSSYQYNLKPKAQRHGGGGGLNIEMKPINNTDHQVDSPGRLTGSYSCGQLRTERHLYA